MPTQSLRRWSASQERKPVRRTARAAARWLARLFVFGGGLLLTAYGTYEMYQVVSVSRTTVLQWVLVGAVHGQLLLDRDRLHQRAARASWLS